MSVQHIVPTVPAELNDMAWGLYQGMIAHATRIGDEELVYPTLTECHHMAEKAFEAAEAFDSVETERSVPPEEKINE